MDMRQYDDVRLPARPNMLAATYGSMSMIDLIAEST